MKYRKLINGNRVLESPETVNLTINTKCPRKWTFVDMETGNIWIHKSRYRKDKRDWRYTFHRIDEKDN